MMENTHVTVIDKVTTKSVVNDKKRERYVAACTCGWTCDPQVFRRQAANAAQVHRANAIVQAL